VQDKDPNYVEDTDKDEQAGAWVKGRTAAALICALLIAAAAGAAAMSVKLSDDSAEPKIHYENTVSSVSTAAVSKKTSAPVKTYTSSVKSDAVVLNYSFPADINSADEECLSSVNGINRNVAEEIVRYREAHGKIHDLNELLDVYGVGERTLAVIKEHFYISEEDKVPLVTTAVTKETKPSKTTTAKVTTEKTRTLKQTSAATSQTTVTTPAPVMREVNINTADAAEIAEALLIDPELAEAIVELRGKIGRFNTYLELMYVDGFSQSMAAERKDYIIL